MDKWNEMHLFVLAIKQGGFSAAARSLNISPSAVSKMISRLEERLGVRLINRTTRTLSLTEAGHTFYLRCNEILQELDDAESELTMFGQRPQGKLKVNCSPGFGKHQLLPLLPSFYEQYPDLTLELQLTGQSIDLVSEGVDLAIRLGQLTDTSLVARPLGESPRIVCATPDYLQRYGVPKTPIELEEHNCLSLSTNETFNQWHFQRNGQQHTIHSQGNFTTDNVEALYDYACMGGGIVRLAGFMVKDAIQRGELLPLLTEYETDKQWVHIVYAHRKFLPVKIRVFVDFLLKNYSVKTTLLPK